MIQPSNQPTTSGQRRRNFALQNPN